MAARSATKAIIENLLGNIYGHIHEHDAVLDLGCGAGYLGRALIEDKGCTVDGVELDHARADAAERVLRHVFRFDLDCSPWPAALCSERYDFLLFGDVLEHLKDPAGVLRRCHALMKPQARIGVSIPNVAHLSIRLELLQGNFEYEDSGILDRTHLKHFTVDSLRRLLAAAHFETIELDYSLNDYPRDTALELLHRVGLRPEAPFWAMVDKPEARAYQFRVVAHAGSSNSAAAPSLPEKPDKLKKRHLGSLNELTRSRDALAEQLRKLERQVDDYERIIAGMRSSRSWQLAQRVKRLRGLFRRTTPRKDSH